MSEERSELNTDDYDFGDLSPVVVPRDFARMFNGQPFPSVDDARPELVAWFRKNCLFCDEGETCNEESDAEEVLAIIRKHRL